MLSVVHYQATNDVFKLKFLEDTSRETIVVCPSPLLADDFRFNLSQQVEIKLDNIDILTISKFMGDEISKGMEDLEVLRKADLLLHLGSIWKKYFSSFSDESFFQAFNLFTELRSFSLDLKLVQDVLENFDENIAKAIKIFWLYLEEAELVDEHMAYQILAEAYRSNDHQVHQFQQNYNIIFWGFGHMSGIQIDLLRALSIRHDVFIPYPYEVWKEAGSTDWIHWLGADDPDNLEESQFDLEEKTLNLVRFGKNRLGEGLISYARDHLDQKKVDIFLTQKTPSFNQLNEIPFANVYFKSKSDLFSQVVIDALIEMKEVLFTSRENSRDSKECINYFQDLIQAELRKSFEHKNFRSIKAFSICLRTIEKMFELSEINKQLSSFDIKILEQVCLLQLPRTYNVPLNHGDVRGQIRGIEGIESFSSENKTIICATSDYQSMKGADNSYDEKTIEFLTSVGPIKRKELDYLMLKKRLIELLSHQNTILFLEKGLDEHDLAWSELLSSFQKIEYCYLKKNKSNLERKDILSGYINKKKQEEGTLYSATRLQSFLDCPRSYYFKYIDRIEPRLKFERVIRPDQLGTLEHDIIRLYIEKMRVWDAEVHSSLVNKVLNEFIQKEKKVLDSLNFESARLELLSYSQNGILELLKLLDFDPKVKFVFESPLPGEDGIRGSVDCLIEGSFGTAVIDFKRSVGGIPSAKEIENFDKIQLWFYLRYLNIDPNDYSFWGYLNLSSPIESKIFSDQADTLGKLKELNFIEGKTTLYKNDLSLKIEAFSSFNQRLVEEIESEEKFLAKPRKADVCHFCSVANICPRTSEVGL